MIEEINTALVLKVIDEMLRNDLETIRAKVTTDEDYALLFLPHPPSLDLLERVYNTVTCAYNGVYYGIEKGKRAMQQHERLAYLEKTLKSWKYKLPYFNKKKQVLRAEMERIQDEFSQEILSPATPDWLQDIIGLAALFVILMKINDPEGACQNALSHDIEKFLQNKVSKE
ncbi:hypothetical protein [Microscilla marina]|uniref:Uncharacterized protein n=1 Tax=Microscilla marina ATCC 23134 TaxID=313606 RepID=A1ZYS5_MICM2|nr:hypothetical protein [Microscilla marina]EAY24499.1 hypothetical protein M23134_06486 [Microscilla marina ATCC 23134]